LRFRLTDFAYEELAQKELGDQNREIHISSQQLCRFLAAMESKVQQVGSLSKHSIAPGVKKRKRSETPPEEIASSDEARYAGQEERAAKRIADYDSDYGDISSIKSLSVKVNTLIAASDALYILAFRFC
jgi:hypothetical protein